jgi:hypothetical protein
MYRPQGGKDPKAAIPSRANLYLGALADLRGAAENGRRVNHHASD